jgi:hypothetical protein
MIPENVKAEDILRAIEEVERLGVIPSGRESEKYDLEYNGKLYPPKYIISLANKYANGKELDHSEFGGGTETNNFLQSLGFNIIGKQNDIDGDFAPRLQEYLENIYSIKVDKSSGRAHLSFPSGAIAHVRGSIILKDRRGFYNLQEEDYKDIVNNTNRFFAVVLGDPEKTFVFPREGLKTFFDGHPLTYPSTSQGGNKPKWYFDIREEDDKHYLRLRSGETNEINIDNYLNKWDQIEDFKHLSERSEHTAPNYWMLVVKDQPEQNLTASQVLVTRMNDKFWGLNARTPSRVLLRRNDKVIFSHGAREFLGTATLDSDSFELPEQEKAFFSHGQDIFEADFGIKLRDTVIWHQQKPVKQYLDVLSFVKRKEQYPVYFQGGVKKLSEKEFESITNISQPKNPLSFIDLQNFLLKEMEMRANYQPIMIKTLLLSGGKLTRDKIGEKIKELNSEKVDQDFKNIPVYDVLEKHGIVRKYDNEFVLNMTELTPEQSKQLIALCDWKILTVPLQQVLFLNEFGSFPFVPLFLVFILINFFYFCTNGVKMHITNITSHT